MIREPTPDIENWLLMFNRRIALISYHTCPLASEEGKETGGMNVYVLELGKRLAQRGILVDAFTRSQDQSQKIVPVVPGFRVIHLPPGPKRRSRRRSFIASFPNSSRSSSASRRTTICITRCWTVTTISPG